MKHKVYYLLAILLVALVSFLSGVLSRAGMLWYEMLNLPSFTPNGLSFGLIWAIIFTLILVSIILFLRKNKKEKELYFNIILILFFLNLLSLLLWNYLFFKENLLFWSIIEMMAAIVFELLLLIALWRNNKLASVLLWPYFAWLFFNLYLNYSIFLLN